MIKFKSALHGSLILMFFIFISSLVAAQFFHLPIVDLTVYQSLNLVKGLICTVVFLYWIFIRYSQVVLTLFNKFKTWQIGVVILLQALEGLFLFFNDNQDNWPIALSINLFITCCIHINLYYNFLSKRLSDLVVVTALGLCLFLFIGYTHEWTHTLVLFSTNLPVLIFFSAISCSLLLAVGIMRIQFKLIHLSEFELLPILIVCSGFLGLVAGGNNIVWLAVSALQLIFIVVLINLIINVDKRFAGDWMLLSNGLNSSSNAYFYCDESGDIRFINDAYKRLFGIKANTPLRKIKHPLHTHPLFETITKALSEKGDWSGETVIIGESGHVVSVHVEFKMIFVNGAAYQQAWFLDIAEKIALRTNEYAIQEKLERLSFNLMDKQEEERRYFAKELHDEIGQGLTLLKIQHQLPDPDKELIKTVLSELIDKVRNLSLNLRPSILDDMGLSAALEWLTDRQRKFSQLAIISDISSNMPRFNDKFEISVFRIAQEAFTNIHKYSHADLVNINCSIEGDYLQLTIEDNGVGFDVGSKLNSAIKGQSLGLLSIQERTFLVNGLIEIISAPEEGTLIRLRVPVLDNGLENNPLDSEQFELRGNDASQ